MNIVNCTPHDISHYKNDGRVILYPYGGQVPRVELKKRIVAHTPESDGPTLMKCEYGAVVGMPEPEEGTTYIVSRMVADACKDQRDDLIIPIDFVRDDRGRIQGCRAFEVLR